MKRLTLLILFQVSIITLSGQEIDSIIDVRDGQIYNIVKIGEQWWMQENLDVGIQINTSRDALDNDTIEKYCYDNDPEMCKIYGGLYTWPEAMNHPPEGDENYEISDNICPIGWHIPTKDEWEDFIDSLGGYWSAGGKLKATGTEYWRPPNYGATNETGFTALPGGFIDEPVGSTAIRDSACFWTATRKTAWNEQYQYAYWQLGQGADHSYGPGWSGVTAASIRCMLGQTEIQEIQVTNKEMELLTKIKFEPGQDEDTILIHNTSARENFQIDSITSLSGAFSGSVLESSLQPGGSARGALYLSHPEKLLVYDTLYIGLSGSKQLLHKIPINAILPLEIAFTDSNQISCYNAGDGTATITPSNGYPPYMYLWNDELQSSDSTLTDMQPNRFYKVMVTDFTGQTLFDSIMLTEPDAINIMAEYSEILCLGSADGYIDLNVSGGVPPYTCTWSNDSSGQNLSGLEPGNYMVTVEDTTGCIEEKDFTIKAFMPPAEEEICLITVDSTSEKIIVLWEPNTLLGISDYIIFRETNTTDRYDSIGTAGVSEPGYFTDAGIDPSEQSYRYKLAILDTCGNRSDSSSEHSSVHLFLYTGQDSVINLLWTEYKGFQVTNYYVWHGSHPDSMAVIKTFSGYVLNCTDKTPLIGKNYYRVEAKKETFCSPGGSTGFFQSSLSNLAASTIVGLEQNTQNPDLLIYPNPVNQQLFIEFFNPTCVPYKMIVRDITGKVVKQENDICTGKFNFSRDGLPNGMYIIELTGTEVLRCKVILK